MGGGGEEKKKGSVNKQTLGQHRPGRNEAPEVKFQQMAPKQQHKAFSQQLRQCGHLFSVHTARAKLKT